MGKPSLSLSCLPQTSVYVMGSTLHGRLRTKDVLLKWGMQITRDCVLCGSHLETLPHLFFDCVYSTEVWQGILLWLHWKRTILTWERECCWIQQTCKSRTPREALLKACFASVVHGV
ncbi:hypothetical protein RDI58_008993 [Solanum bulbocastanum]|uniref:Reverse transcriptase zinc-binding domain-containing protein n=1 Tax=Solanum bulbocastanum TaxID=147425 RepID=A0AAN8TYN0_SOLBU